MSHTFRALSRRINHIACRNLNRHFLRFDCAHPIVSFTFDDFPASAYHTGGKILEQYDARGTYYVSLGLEAVENHQGRHFVQDDLGNLLESGHELGNHTYSHVTCDDADACAFEEDTLLNQRRIEQLFPGREMEAFSFPKGVVKPKHHSIITDHFETARTIVPGINRNDINLNYLNATPLYEHNMSKDSIRRLRDSLLEKPGWLVFYTHDIRSAPSRFGVTSSLFECAVREVSLAGIPIMPVIEAVRYIIRQRNC